MRVGFITGDLSHQHGWAHYSLEIAKALTAAGLELKIAASENTPNTEHLPIIPCLPTLVPRARFLLPRLFLARRKVQDLFRDCDIIHCTVEPFAPLGAWVAGKRPFFQAGVGSYLHLNNWQRFPMTALYRHAFQRSRLICISHYTECVAKTEFPGIQSDVVTLGINAARFENLPPLQVEKRGLTILTVGGIKPRKGTLELVKAVAVVRQQFPDIQCIIAGNTAEGSAYTQQVKQTIETLQLHDTVHLAGFLPENELMAWYSAADLFVLPSINAGWMFEGYGLVHMEASAAGLPVIGTYGCGVEDAVDDGVTGLLVSQSNIDEELPQAIMTLLSNPDLRRQMGAAGREKARRQSWSWVANQIIGLYENALTQ